MGNLSEVFGDPIHVYTQQQAIEDGVLVTLPVDLCQEAGIRFPVVVTTAVHDQVIEWGPTQEAANPGTGQGTTGRAWDLLVMLHHAIAQHLDAKIGDRVPVEVLVVPGERREEEPQLVQVHAVLTVETGEPSLVIMQPTED